MKKIIFIFSILVFSINIYSINDNAEKYYNFAIKYYLDGNLDDALNILTRALQIDSKNVKYSSLYDMILSEKQKLKVIHLEKPETKKGEYENYINYDKLLLNIKNYINKREQQQNQRVLNLVNALAKENAEIKNYQNNVLDKKITENFSVLKDLMEKYNYVILIISISLFILILLILLIFYIQGRIKKIHEKVKILALKQDEQHNHILKLEEQQKKLTEKGI